MSARASGWILLALVGLGCGRGAPPAGSVTGAADGQTEFGTVSSALWIGQPDDPADTVLFLFSRQISCAELGKAGWDGRIDSGAQMFELVAKGTAAGSYAAPAQSEINHTFLSSGVESTATSGMLSLTWLAPSERAEGTFDGVLKHPVSGETHAMSGAFTAAFCPDAVEP